MECSFFEIVLNITKGHRSMDIVNRAANIYSRSGLPALIFYSLRYPLYHINKKLNILKLFYSISLVDTICYSVSIELLHRHMENEETIDDIIHTTQKYSGYGNYKSIDAAQVTFELRELAELVDSSDPKTIMEIGTKNGGTLYVWTRYFDSTERVISLDLPGGEFGGGYPKNQKKLFKAFSKDKEIMCVRKNSHSEKTYSHIENILGEKSIDFLFIDADHTYDGVKQDFEMYKKLVSDGGIIAFHDIVPHPNDPNVNVDKFWNEIKKDHEYEEIVATDDQSWAGIGVITL